MQGIYLLMFISVLTAQTVDYTYDNNGNRIRRYISLKSAHISESEAGVQDESNTDQDNKEEYTDQLQDFLVKVYPNPTRGELYVEISGTETGITAGYQIFSQAGRLLEQKPAYDLFFTIDFSAYPAGLYILRLNISGQTSVWNIINEK